MLDQIDLSRKLNKKEWKGAREELQERLGELQRQAKALTIPTLVILEGWDAAGKGTLLNRILQPLDPRGFRVYNVSRPSEEARMRPYLWAFWRLLPEEGRIVFMNRSWYRRLLDGRFGQDEKLRQVDEDLEETRHFESQLHQSGMVLVKFFIHITKREQRKRLKALDKKAEFSWRVQNEEWQRHKHYEELFALTEEVIRATDTGDAAWTVVNGQDERLAEVQMLSTLVKALEEAVALRQRTAEASDASAVREDPRTGTSYSEPELTGSALLREADLRATCSEKDYKKELPELQERLREIQCTLYRERIPAVVAFEGWDAAGKGGAIKRLTENLDPRGYEVHPTSAPNDFERAHYHLWRFWRNFPKAGHIAIFDRTWYGRVLVERVEGFCSPEEWRRAYSEINEMEAQWLRYGTIIVKFWLHIDQDEQLKRFKERQDSPQKSWKITDEDWRNREKWPQYQKALEEMLLRTSTLQAPWTVVEANSKEYARLKVLRTVIQAAETAFKALRNQ
ncbi:MAG: polyphosphate:AMP phosphotransferase [Fretibacterium sp.]|nr:polyphosphate:AMP phosphotransferase [Fretibacterium sp.]